MEIKTNLEALIAVNFLAFAFKFLLVRIIAYLRSNDQTQPRSQGSQNLGTRLYQTRGHD